MNSMLRILAGALLGLVTALPAAAQLVTNSVPRQRTVPLQETIEQTMAGARWHWGPFRIQPRINLTNFGYNNNVYGVIDENDAIDDWSATVQAGIEAYLPFGPKTVIRARALPEYSWYQELEERRHLGGQYDVSLLGFFNRLTLEANGFTEDRQTIINSEREAIGIREGTGGSARVELEIFQRLALFAGGDQRTLSHERPIEIDDPELQFQRLDRDESAARAGVRYRFRSYFDVALMQEQTATEFEIDSALRDNESEATLLSVHYDRPKFFVNLTGGNREGTAANGSSFIPYSETTGSYFAQYRLTAPIDFEVFGRRDVVYGLYANNPYFLESRNGAGLGVQFGRRLLIRGWTETGSNDYPDRGAAAAPIRSDDVTLIGASLSVPLWRQLVLTVGGTETDYDSNISGYDRSILRWTSTIGLRRAIFR